MVKTLVMSLQDLEPLFVKRPRTQKPSSDWQPNSQENFGQGRDQFFSKIDQLYATQTLFLPTNVLNFPFRQKRLCRWMVTISSTKVHSFKFLKRCQAMLPMHIIINSVLFMHETIDKNAYFITLIRFEVNKQATPLVFSFQRFRAKKLSLLLGELWRTGTN